MANRQHYCEAELKHWQKQFFKIQLPASKVMAVNRLWEFANEYRQLWPDTREKAAPTHPLPPTESEPPVSVTFLEVRDGGVKADFSGVLEGAGAKVFPVLAVEPPAVTHAVVDPSVVTVNVYGVCPNSRLLAGQLPDGQVVAVWKGSRHWRLPVKIPCRKDSNSPNYTPV